jgi:hypothetical protein
VSINRNGPCVYLSGSTTRRMNWIQDGQMGHMGTYTHLVYCFASPLKKYAQKLCIIGIMHCLCFFHKFFNRLDVPWVNIVWDKHYKDDTR